MKKNIFITHILCLSFLIFFSCRDDFNYKPATKPLGFSSDTILIDTVFSSIRSSTYLLKVYNLENKDITIPKIFLEQGSESLFKINVDGKPAEKIDNNSFENIPLRSRDSMYVFIEIAPQNITTSESIAEDNLVFSTIGSTQKIKLLSLIENADFFFSKTGTKEISTNTIWDSTKVKVIYGDLKFTEGAKLTIEKGTKVYFHKNASLTIEKNGELIINGKLNKEVILRGDRHSMRYDSLPANWNQIYIASNAKANINYAIIKGGTRGILLDNQSELTIKNTKIYNFLDKGIQSTGGKIIASNLAVNNCSSACLFLENGGNYDFTHCSFANFWNLISGGDAYALYLSESHTNNIEPKPINASFKNSIFWVRRNNSILLNINLPNSNYSFLNNLIKNNSSSLIIEGNPNFSNTIINQDPLFFNISFANTLLALKPNSPAFNAGNSSYANQVPLDIRGKNRTVNPSLGAYQE